MPLTVHKSTWNNFSLYFIDSLLVVVRFLDDFNCYSFSLIFEKLFGDSILFNRLKTTTAEESLLRFILHFYFRPRNAMVPLPYFVENKLNSQVVDRARKRIYTSAFFRSKCTQPAYTDHWRGTISISISILIKACPVCLLYLKQ